MTHGIILTTGDPRTLADLAVAAETSGWDSVFYWDAVAIPGVVSWNPWVVMSAIATRTERVTIGAIVTRVRPRPRRRCLAFPGADGSISP